MKFSISSRVLVAALILSFCAAHVQAAPRLLAVEEALESDTETLILPSTDTGTVLRRGCDQCNVNPPRLTSNTRFFLGEKNISFADMQKLLSRSKQPRALLIFHRLSDRTITRFVIVD